MAVRSGAAAALWDATTAAGDHFLAIKVNYWLGVK